MRGYLRETPASSCARKVRCSAWCGDTWEVATFAEWDCRSFRTTLPAARGKGVYTRLSAGFFRYYVDQAAKSCSGIVEARNTIMRNWMKKMGFAGKTKLSFLKIGSLSLIVTTDLATMARHVAIEPGNRGGWDVI